jgi:hypothetical protein
MKDFLKKHGINVRVKLIEKGSMAGCWRLLKTDRKPAFNMIDKLIELGFKDFDWKPLSESMTNKYLDEGFFCMFLRRDCFIFGSNPDDQILADRMNIRISKIANNS